MLSSFGPKNAKILIVVDSPTKGDVLAGHVLSGIHGDSLAHMLHEAGILLTECRVTSVAQEYHSGYETKRFFEKYTSTYQLPKQVIMDGMVKLQEEILSTAPNLVIALGDLPLWALTGEMSAAKWRGSILNNANGMKIIPTYSPAVIQRKYDWRFMAVQDLRRCKKEAEFTEVRVPDYDFLIRPNFENVMGVLQRLLDEADTHGVWGGFKPNQYHGNTPNKPAHTPPTKPPLILSGDVETRGGTIACMGIGWSKTEALCIPFICVEKDTGYWSAEEELAIVLKLKDLFLHPNIGWIFQNGLYDYQYFAKWWGFLPSIYMDTMLAQHTCFAGLPKALAFQASVYCEHYRYWKDEGKDFHKSIKSQSDEELYWVYNCKDCVTTYEIYSVHETNIKNLKAEAPYHFQMEQFIPVLMMMVRGVLADTKLKKDLFLELTEAIYTREVWLQEVIGKHINIKSPKQMANFLYEELDLPVQRVRKTNKPTTNNEALTSLILKEPLVKPILMVFQELRSLNVFLGTFIKAPVSPDGRFRSSYNIAGTETYRWSSSKDAFGHGLNLQNLPKGNEKDD